MNRHIHLLHYLKDNSFSQAASMHAKDAASWFDRKQPGFYKYLQCIIAHGHKNMSRSLKVKWNQGNDSAVIALQYTVCASYTCNLKSKAHQNTSQCQEHDSELHFLEPTLTVYANIDTQPSASFSFAHKHSNHKYEECTSEPKYSSTTHKMWINIL